MSVLVGPPMLRTKVIHPIRHRRAGVAQHEWSPSQSGRYTQDKRAGQQRQRPCPGSSSARAGCFARSSTWFVPV